MLIVKIGQFGAKLHAFEIREKWRKMSDFSRIHVIKSFLVIFRDFQTHVTLRQIDRFYHQWLLFVHFSHVKFP